MHQFFCLLFFVSFLNQAQAQNEGTKWYFGAQAGLDFMTNPPTILTNGVMTTQEGCASIADGAGNLLFYTDGLTIWNASHVTMPNGTGLMGNGSTTQSGVIIKQPGANSLYIVFTLDFQGNVNGLRYSIVDMSLSSGTGSVTTKNVLLQTPSSEKLTAVRHCNGTDIWVVSHDLASNNFRTFLVTATGVNTTPINSAVGPVHNNMLGYMKASPNGRKLGLAVYTTNNSFEVYDFDNSTGVVSNAIVLGSAFTLPYGCDFSPNGRYFYGCNATALTSGALYQWDLCAGSATAIIATQTTIVTTTVSLAAMQLAPNGKIYVGRYLQSTIGVINNPNNAGTACNYVDLGQSVSPKVCRLGLPNFVTSIFRPLPSPFTYVFNSALSCLNASFTAPPSQTCGSMGYTTVATSWDFGDPSSGASNAAFGSNVTHSFSAVGNYTVRMVTYYTCGSDTVNQLVVVPSPTLLVQTTSVNCSTPGSGTVYVSGGPASITYTWLPVNQTSSVVSSLSAGNYTILLSSPGAGCNYSTTATVGSFNSFSLTVFSSTPTCIGANTATAGVTLVGGIGPFTYSWTGTAQTTPTVTGLGSGSYTVSVTDVTSLCTLTRTFQIVQPPALTLNITANTPSVCLGGSITFTALALGGTGTYTYNWVAGPATATRTVLQALPGNYTYTLGITDSNGCTFSNTVSSQFVAYPALSASSATICINTSHTLTASGATNYTWLPGSTFTSSMVVSPTVNTNYTVTGMSASCFTSATVSISIKPYPSFAFNSFSITCGSLGSATITPTGGIGPFNYTWSPTGFNGSAVNNLFPGNYTVTSFDAGTGCRFTPTINFAPLIPLTGTVVSSPSIACNGINTGSASIVLAGGSGSQTYQWTDASGIKTVAQPTNLAAGIVTVFVQDAITFCSVTKTFVIIQPTPLNIVISASSPSACLGSSITLVGLNSGGIVGSGYTYTWSSGSNSNSLAVSEASASSYQYTLSSLDGNNCLASKTISLLFVSNPTITVSSASICPLKQATLSALGANNFVWSTGHNGPVLQISPLTSTNYTVIGNSLGCTDTAVASVFLYTSPVPSFTTNAPICQSQDLIMNASGGNSYFISGPNSFTSSANSVTLSLAQPSLSGNYQLLIQSVQGCTAGASASVVVHATPLLSASAGTVCQGATIVLNSNFLPGGSYTWFGPGFTASTQSAVVLNAQLSNAGTYSVIATSAVGCTNMAFANASVQAPIQASITVDSSFCKGDNLVFQASGGLSYVWQGPNAFYASVQSPSLMNAATVATGLYTLTAVNGACSSTTVKSLTVFAPPVLSISGPTLLCENVSLNLTASGASSYSWTGPNSFSAISALAAINPFTSSKAGQYKVIGKDVHACQSSDSIVVNAQLAPLISVQNNTVCFGGIVTLTASSNGQLTWTDPFGGIITGTSINIPVTSTLNTGVYQITSVSSNSCISTASLSLTGVNGNLPAPLITGSKKACLGASLDLIGSGGTEYNWSGPLGTAMTGTHLALTVTSTSYTGTYTLVVRNAQGCAVSSTIMVQVFPPPRVSVSHNPLIGCLPYCATVQVEKLDSSAALTEIMYYQASKNVGKGKLNYCFTKDGPLDFRIEYKDSNTCVGRSNLTYTMYEKPTADFYYSPTRPIAAQDPVYFYNSSSGNGLSSWSWFFETSDSIASQEKNPIYLFAKPGNYPVVEIVKNIWGCSDTIIKMVTISGELSLYVPNAFTPNSDGLNDVFLPKGEGIKTYHLLIFNRWGDLIFETNSFTEGWDGRFKGEVCKVDAYVWKITYTAADDKKKELTGSVMLTK